MLQYLFSGRHSMAEAIIEHRLSDWGSKLVEKSYGKRTMWPETHKMFDGDLKWPRSSDRAKWPDGGVEKSTVQARNFKEYGNFSSKTSVCTFPRRSTVISLAHAENRSSFRRVHCVLDGTAVCEMNYRLNHRLP